MEDRYGNGPLPPPFTVRVLAGAHTVKREIHAYSLDQGELILYVAQETGDHERLRYHGVALFPPGQWQGMEVTQGESAQVPPTRIGFQTGEPSREG